MDTGCIACDLIFSQQSLTLHVNGLMAYLDLEGPS